MPLRSSDDEEMVFVDDPDEPVPDDVTMDENPGCDQEGAASQGGSSSTEPLSPR